MPKGLWKCAKCGRWFANRNQSHACGRLSDLNAHFARCDAGVRELFDALEDAVRQCGPVTVLPEKTRIAFHRRISFLGVMPRKDHLIVGFLFSSRVEDPRFEKIETYSPRNHGHRLRLRDVREIDDQFRSWIRAAYAVGEQKHLELHSS
jgi:uncharacterized protein DUF5655